MKQLTFWFDPISPFACLAFERLPQALEGLSCSVRYRPILFAGLLKSWGQKGPAEIEPKRAWTYRQVMWLAHRLDLPLQMPAQHPYNPLALLRLMLACAPAGGTPNRWVCETVLRHVWRGGHDANDAARLSALTQALAPQQDPNGGAVKERLRADTAAALSQAVFGVPTIEVDGRLFWGLDSLEMLAAYLHGDPWFDAGTWDHLGRHHPAQHRVP
jgi:2-hydroxychromene-2-carboxylate isomerase